MQDKAWSLDGGNSFSCGQGNIPSLQLTVRALKIGGWETTFLLGYGLFSGYVSFNGKQFLICWETVLQVKKGHVQVILL